VAVFIRRSVEAQMLTTLMNVRFTSSKERTLSYSKMIVEV
jgi:hypothetical protein